MRCYCVTCRTDRALAFVGKVLAVCLGLFLGWLMSGCSITPSHAYTVHLDPAFTPDQSEAFLSALDTWSDAVPVTFTVVSDVCHGVADGHICTHAAGVSPDPSYIARTGGYIDLEGRHDGGDIVIYLGSIPDRLPTVMAHELGHAMGLDHDVAGTLMAPRLAHMADGPTCADVGRWLALRN